ncbi:hypothetical protein NMG60_11019354 [Bertholletia excelsa]
MATKSREFSHRDGEQSEEMADTPFPRKRCCFCIPYFGSNRSPAVAGARLWQRMRLAAEGGGEGWWSRGVGALKKLREWSEIVAGPRWKTFIRRFNRSKSGRYGGKFQYDPLSYALNFDDGRGQNCNLDEEYGFRNFSSRYAAIPTSAKSSMDLGKDAPTFT